ncbi:LysR family transcriptional regulator [Gordonia hydrophobica]|uniref:LysR family transcriptional regulator n=1 Tax=Gordonia hydrophobica TaxID=40516 RepID=A0ABZ2U6T7_9ACTN|nr:LysR family transcriptional regulator [Gordonia hydrophobica]MBM7366126.1 DNA-binding transcriptional LysR family regulator [Gordonia hydrophobica]
MLNMDRLRTLCLVAELGSLADAAAELRITPSGVSQQLARLEAELGVAVVEREGRGVRLTDAGMLLARRGAGIVSQLERAESEVASLHGEVVGQLRFGSFVSASRSVLPQTVAALRDDHPHLDVTLWEGEAEELLPRVRRRQLDVAVVDSWSTHPLEIPADMELTPLYSDVAELALPAEHALAGREVVRLAELSGLGWASWSEGTQFHDWLVQSLRTQGVDPRIDFQVADYATHLEFVGLGLAMTLIPQLAKVSVPAGVVLVRTEPTLSREISALVRRDNDRPTVRAGIDALRSAFAQL